MTSPGELIQFRHLGLENFDWQVLSVIIGRLMLAALLGGILAYRPWRYFMHWHFERTESGAQVLIAVAGALMTSIIGNNCGACVRLSGAWRVYPIPLGYQGPPRGRGYVPDDRCRYGLRYRPHSDRAGGRSERVRATQHIGHHGSKPQQRGATPNQSERDQAAT